MRFVVRRAPTTEFWIIDKGTGERRRFSSLDELPPEVREQLAKSDAFGKAVHKTRSISFQGPDGQKRTFHSVEEMPPDIREMYEKLGIPEIKSPLGEVPDEGKSS